MNLVNHLLLAPAAILTVVTGIFLLRESFVRKDPADAIGALKSRTLGALIFLSSLLSIGFICSFLWSRSGLPAAIAVLFVYSLAMVFGHRLIRSQLAWQCLINATVGAWIVWFAGRDGRISGQDVFLLSGLATWIVTSLYLGWRHAARSTAGPQRTGETGKDDQ